MMTRAVLPGLLMLSALLMAAGEPQNNTTAQPEPAAGTPATQPAAPPAPGPEVMKPTEHGVRLTPAMARAYGKVLALKLKQEKHVTPEHQEQLAEAFAKRLMQTGRANQEQLQKSVEGMLALFPQLSGQSAFTPETARDFGEKCAPLLPMLREFIQAAGKDIEMLEGAERAGKLGADLKEADTQLQKVEEQMNRWARGEYRAGERPFEVSEDSATGPAAAVPAAALAEPVKPEMQRAEREAKFTVDFVGPPNWYGFVAGLKRAFKLTPEQDEKLRAILVEYQKKANAIMTLEWKGTLRANRIQYGLRDSVGKDNAPFFYHLQKQYEATVQPVIDLGQAFRAEALAVITSEQRAQALADLRKTADAHGLVLEPLDEPLLGLAVTQPAAEQ